MRHCRTLATLVLALGSAGCASPDLGVDYYWQSVTGHWRLMNAARPVQDWVNDTGTPPALRERLLLARRIRAFAASELGLPDNASYHRYADLPRRAAIYNVVAAPALSLTLQTWCFPVAGCVGYRGYFDESAAQAFARGLPGTLEVAVYPVPAYSTLGWMNWAGGDPLLSTFIAYPEGELARLLFHELAHQVVYAKDDTVFNESFATAVERLGGQRWLAQQANGQARAEYRAFDARRRLFQALTRSVRQRLQAVYGDDTLDDPEKRRRKATVMADFRREYQSLKTHWGGYAGFDAWVARANNASFGAQAAYDEWVPGFIAVFEREGHDFSRFYEAVRALAKQPRDARQAVLRQLAAPETTTRLACDAGAVDAPARP